MCSYYPYTPFEAKSDLSNTLGKCEMETAAANIISQAQRRGRWGIGIYLSDYSGECLRGMELLAGYGWLLFDINASQECWRVTPELIKRVCQSAADRDLEKAILEGEVKDDDYPP